MFLLQTIHLPNDNLFSKSLINILPFKMLNVSFSIHLPKFIGIICCIWPIVLKLCH